MELGVIAFMRLTIIVAANRFAKRAQQLFQSADLLQTDVREPILRGQGLQRATDTERLFNVLRAQICHERPAARAYFDQAFGRELLHSTAHRSQTYAQLVREIFDVEALSGLYAIADDGLPQGLVGTIDGAFASIWPVPC